MDGANRYRLLGVLLVLPNGCRYTASFSETVQRLTLQRVQQSIYPIFTLVGTLARPPKRRGKTSGWPSGRQRTMKQRFAVVKKTSTAAKTARNSICKLLAFNPTECREYYFCQRPSIKHLQIIISHGEHENAPRKCKICC